MSADPEQQKIESLASERNKKLDVLSRVSPTLYNDAKTRESVSEPYDEEISRQEEKYIERKNAELAREQAAEQKKIDAERQAKIEADRKAATAEIDAKIDQAIKSRDAAVAAVPNEGNRSKQREQQNIIIQDSKRYVESLQRDRNRKLNNFEYSIVYGNRSPDASVSRTFEKSGGQMSLIDLQSKRDESRQAKTDYDSRSSVVGAQSAAITESEKSAISYYESSQQIQQSKKAAQQRDAAKVNTDTLNALGVPSSSLTKSGDLGIVFPAAKKETPVEKTNQEKTEDVLQSYSDYKLDQSPLTQPNASNFLPIDVPEPNRTSDKGTLSEYYSIWNETHPQKQSDEPAKKSATITTKSEKILNQYFLYQHGLTSLSDDVASDGKPRILPTPKKEDMQNEINASEFYKKWTERYGDLTKADLESTGIFSDPDKLQRVRELNEQQRNVTVDPAALLLKESIDIISNQKYQPQSELIQTESTQPKSKNVKIIRDGLILIRTDDYAVIQTPNYTRLVVYPTADKEGYLQILTQSQQQQKPSHYIFDEGLSESERTTQMWKTTNFLVDTEPQMPTETDKKINKYIQDNFDDVVAAESNPTKQGYINKQTDNDFFEGLTGHATELHVMGASVYEYAKGGTPEEIEGRIFAIQNKLEYKPTGEASVITDIINSGRSSLYGEPVKPSETKKFVESSSMGYMAGSIVGTLATAIIPVNKIGSLLKPITKIKTVKTAESIASKTIPQGVAYSIEVDKSLPSRAIVWVGSEEASKQTIRTRPKENTIADAESGTGRASFDVMKIDTKSKTVEFIKIQEAADKDKIISQIKMETRGTKTANKLGLEEYDTQGAFAYSQGYTNFKNIWDLSLLEKSKDVKQLATGEVRPLKDVTTNPEMYGDVPILSTVDNAKGRLNQFMESLEGGKEPRISGRVGYFVEKPKDGKPRLIDLPDDIRAKLEEKEPLGTRAAKEQRERNEKLINDYLQANPRTYESKSTTETKTSRPYNYDVLESELSRLTKDTSDKSKSKAVAKTESKESPDVESIKELLSFEPTESKAIHLPTAKQNTQSKSYVELISDVGLDLDTDLAMSSIQNVSSKTSLDSLSKMGLLEDVIQGSKLYEQQKSRQSFDEDLAIIPKLLMNEKLKFDLDLDMPHRLITDQPLKQDDDLLFVPRLMQTTDNDIPEKLLLKIPEIFEEKNPPFKLFMFDDEEEQEETPLKKLKFFKRSFISNVPFFSAFGLLQGDELSLGKESKINKLEKKMLKF